MQTKQRDVRRSVSIIVSRGWLQLRFSYGGKRHYISVGLRDTPTNRKIAEAKAKLIESDIIYERFDPTLEKYKPQT
ncbi:site-specific integrase, partial [filamentous cyanobacterium CCP1]